MRTFGCPHCGAWIEFEDRVCLNCRTRLAYDPGTDRVVRAEEHLLCEWRDVIRCPWVAAEAGECVSCALTRERPDLENAVALAELVVAEYAKRRLIRQLVHLGIPVAPPLAFELCAPLDGGRVITGHRDGVITIDLSESNDAHREALRVKLGEPYRTMLGHMRHEIGHFYWLELVSRTDALLGFRECFGDERADYGAALDAHYDDGPGAEWAVEHISQYATTHPWEDFAETFAHYLHIADALETSATVGVLVHGPNGVPAPLAGSLRVEGRTDIADLRMSEVLTLWHGFSLALNSINRSMGKDDLYPFVITPTIAKKLAFVHDLVRS